MGIPLDVQTEDPGPPWHQCHGWVKPQQVEAEEDQDPVVSFNLHITRQYSVISIDSRMLTDFEKSFMCISYPYFDNCCT